MLAVAVAPYAFAAWFAPPSPKFLGNPPHDGMPYEPFPFDSGDPVLM